MNIRISAESTLGLKNILKSNTHILSSGTFKVRSEQPSPTRF